MDAQAGMRICCSQSPEDRFSRIKAHILFREENSVDHDQLAFEKSADWDLHRFQNMINPNLA